MRDAGADDGAQHIYKAEKPSFRGGGTFRRRRQSMGTFVDFGTTSHDIASRTSIAIQFTDTLAPGRLNRYGNVVPRPVGVTQFQLASVVSNGRRHARRAPSLSATRIDPNDTHWPDSQNMRCTTNEIRRVDPNQDAVLRFRTRPAAVVTIGVPSPDRRQSLEEGHVWGA